MEHKEHVEIKINKAISELEKKAKSLIRNNNINVEKEAELIALCYNRKQALLSLQDDLSRDSKLDVEHLIDDSLENHYLEFVKILGVETNQIKRKLNQKK